MIEANGSIAYTLQKSYYLLYFYLIKQKSEFTYMSDQGAWLIWFHFFIVCIYVIKSYTDAYLKPLFYIY